MSRVRFLADENFPEPVTVELRRLGHDVVTLAELGRANQSLPDEEVLALAVEHERALLTINRRHFIRLHEEQPDHEGIVVCTLDVDFEGQARRISEAARAEQSVEGRLIRVNRPG